MTLTVFRAERTKAVLLVAFVALAAMALGLAREMASRERMMTTTIDSRRMARRRFL